MGGALDQSHPCHVYIPGGGEGEGGIRGECRDVLDTMYMCERSVHCSKPLQRPGQARLNKG